MINKTYYQRRSKSTYECDFQPMMITQPVLQEKTILNSVKEISHQHNLTRSIDYSEDYRISLLKYNALFLKKKVMPLSEQNSMLKDRVQALIYYLEQCRLDFASLIKQVDGQGQSRDMDKQIGDLFTIYSAIKEDLLSDAALREQQVTQILDLQDLIEQSSSSFKQAQDISMKEFDERSANQFQELNKKSEQAKALHEIIQEMKETILSLNQKNSEQSQLHQTELMMHQKKIQQHVTQTQQLERVFAQDIQDLKDTNLRSLNKQNQTHLSLMSDLKNECDDQIVRNNTKGQRLQGETKSLRDQLQSTLSQLKQLQQQDEKLASKLESQVNENARARKQVNNIKEELQEAINKIQGLLQSNTRSHNDKLSLEGKLAQSQQSCAQQEDHNRLLQSEIVHQQLQLVQRKQIQDQLNQDNTKLMLQQDELWRKKIFQCQNKFEKLLAIKKVQFVQSEEIVKSQTKMNDPECSLEVNDPDASLVEGLYETSDIACQKDDNTEKEQIKKLESHNQELTKEVQIRIQNENTYQIKMRMEFLEKKKKIEQETQDMLQNQSEQFDKVCEQKIVSLKYKCELEHAILQKQIIKSQSECDAMEFMMNTKVGSLEVDIQKFTEEAEVNRDKYVEVRCMLYRMEESIVVEKQKNIDTLKQQDLDSSQQQEAHKVQNEALKGELQSNTLISQTQIKQLNIELTDVTKQRSDLNTNLLFVQMQSNQKSKQAVERDKIIDQLNERVKQIQLELDLSKQVYNIFKTSDPMKAPSTRVAELLDQFGQQQTVYSKPAILNRTGNKTSVFKQDHIRKVEKIVTIRGGHIIKGSNESAPSISQSFEYQRLPQVRGFSNTIQNDEDTAFLSPLRKVRSRRNIN